MLACTATMVAPAATPNVAPPTVDAQCVPCPEHSGEPVAKTPPWRQPLLHAVSGEVMGERPNVEGLHRLRGKVLGLLQVRIQSSATRLCHSCLTL